VDIQVGLIQKRLEENGVRLEVSDSARNRLATLGYDPQYGARPLKRVLQREILNQLSRKILSGEVQRDAAILVDLRDEVEFVFENLTPDEVVN